MQRPGRGGGILDLMAGERGRPFRFKALGEGRDLSGVSGGNPLPFLGDLGAKSPPGNNKNKHINNNLDIHTYTSILKFPPGPRKQGWEHHLTGASKTQGKPGSEPLRLKKHGDNEAQSH